MLDPLPSKISLSAQNSEIKLDDVASEVNSQRWEKNNSVTQQDSDHENHHSRDQIQLDATKSYPPTGGEIEVLESTVAPASPQGLNAAAAVFVPPGETPKSPPLSHTSVSSAELPNEKSDENIKM